MDNGLRLEFKANHRITTFEILPKLYKPSIYRYPFLSVRFLCFWFVHDWNKIGERKK